MKSQRLSFLNTMLWTSILIEVQTCDGNTIWKTDNLGHGKRVNCDLKNCGELKDMTQLKVVVFPNGTRGKEYTFYQRDFLYYTNNNHESKFTAEGMRSAWDLVVSQE